MAKQQKKEAPSLEIVEPIGKRVLIRKDEDKKQSKGGIQLPDNIEIPTITGRIVTISAEIENDEDIIRLDILYGVKAIYPDLAARLVG